MTSVLVLPDESWTDRDAVLAGITGALDVRGGFATEICADVLRLSPAPPVIVVAHGTGCAALPALALAQRTAHRRVGAYVLVEPDAPASSDTWPDAPVFVVTDDEHRARLCALRGWTVSDQGVRETVALAVAESG